MKNIIFDLGGVIINIDYFKTEQMFVDNGIANFGELFSQMKQSDLFDRLETGKIGELDFYNELRSVAESDISDGVIKDCWNAMLLDIPKERLDLLSKLKEEGYRIFLFSNTNIIHLVAFNQIAKEQHGLENLDGFFETAYYSHEFGRRKPHAESFQAILDKESLKPEDTLFIDDTMMHVEGARKTGMLAHFLTGGEAITDLDFTSFWN